jgi:hypothetical protein
MTKVEEIKNVIGKKIPCNGYEEGTMIRPFIMKIYTHKNIKKIKEV